MVRLFWENNCVWSLTIFTKTNITDVRHGPIYTSEPVKVQADLNGNTVE